LGFYPVKGLRERVVCENSPGKFICDFTQTWCCNLCGGVVTTVRVVDSRGEVHMSCRSVSEVSEAKLNDKLARHAKKCTKLAEELKRYKECAENEWAYTTSSKRK
jgi:hypothetical protein